jgi:hypothetical protein
MLSTGADGNTQVGVTTRTISNNMILSHCWWNCGTNGPSSGGGHSIDHDDGSSGYVDLNNVLVYGAVKTRDGVNRTVSGNLVLWGDDHVTGLLEPQCGGQNSTAVHNNTAVAASGLFYDCVRSPGETDFPTFTANHFYSKPLANGSLPFAVTDWCHLSAGSLATWQSQGLDAGSTISGSITTAEIVSHARRLLGLAATDRESAATTKTDDAASLGRHQPPRDGSIVAHRVLLTEAAARDGAVAIDGSAGSYHIAKSPPSSPNASKWHVHLQGGGWCWTVADCAGRALGSKGSSDLAPNNHSTKILPDECACAQSGYFSADPRRNPTMHDWNHAHINYVDGGSFSGNRSAPVLDPATNQTLYFRGKRVLRAVLLDMLASQGMDAATEVVLTGCSAGGLAVYLQADYVRSLLPKATQLVAVPDSGYFYAKGSFEGLMRNAATRFFNMETNSACETSRATKAGDCAFAQFVAPFVKTPIFAVQSIFDGWQMDEIARPPDWGRVVNSSFGEHCCKGESTACRAAVNRFGSELNSSLNVLLSDPKNGGFIDSCNHHCGSWASDLTMSFINPRVGGVEVGAAFDHWYSGGDTRAWRQSRSFPCKDCCHSATLPMRKQQCKTDDELMLQEDFEAVANYKSSKWEQDIDGRTGYIRSGPANFAGRSGGSVDFGVSYCEDGSCYRSEYKRPATARAKDLALGGTYWFGFTLMLPSNDTYNDTLPPNIFHFQLHGGDDIGRGPILGLSLHNATKPLRWRIYSAGDDTPSATASKHAKYSQTFDLGPVTFGFWEDYVIKIRLECTPNGSLSVWRNTAGPAHPKWQFVVNESKISTAYNDTLPPYIKTGAYLNKPFKEKTGVRTSWWSARYWQLKVGGGGSSFDSVSTAHEVKGGVTTTETPHNKTADKRLQLAEMVPATVSEALPGKFGGFNLVSGLWAGQNCSYHGPHQWKCTEHPNNASFGSEDDISAVVQYRQKMGANSVALTFNAYVKDTGSTGPIYSKPWSPTVSQLRKQIVAAHAAGMTVMLRPLVAADYANTSDKYGNQSSAHDIGFEFSAADWDTYTRNYIAWHLPFVALAQELKVALFCIGVESWRQDRGSATTTNPNAARNFRKIAASVRQGYGGKLTYSANFGAATTIEWWDAVDYIGIDAYYPLQVPGATPNSCTWPAQASVPQATVAELVSAYTPFVDQVANLSSKFGGKSVLFTEIGYRSCPASQACPGASCFGHGSAAVQANMVEAMFQAWWGRPFFAGFHWWGVDSLASKRADPTNFDPKPPAVAVFKRWLTRTSG